MGFLDALLGRYTPVQPDLDHGAGSVCFGHARLFSRRAPDSPTSLVSDLHPVNTALQESGLGSRLLCSGLPRQVNGGDVIPYGGGAHASSGHPS